MPVPKVNVGVPVTSTASERVTVIVIVSSALYDPSAVVAVTLVIVGAVVSSAIVNPNVPDVVLEGESKAR